MEKIKLLKSVILCVLITLFLTGCMESALEVEVIKDDSTTTTKRVAAYEDDYKIYLITMDLADDFWLSIDSGCRQAVDELGCVNYKWIGPDVNEDSLQMDCIDQAVAEGADAILVAASSLTGVNPSLQKAADAGIKIIFVDNAAQFDYVAFLATDNELAGKIAGETMQKALEEAGITSGKIGIMVNKANVISTAARVKGFREIFKGTNFVRDDTFFMEDHPQRIKNFVREHPEYVAFFGSNERTTLAIGDQIRNSTSKQIVVGFDTSDEVLALLYDGVLYATLQQNPKNMGYSGMKIAVEALQGLYTDKNVKVDTGVTIVYKNTI